MEHITPQTDISASASTVAPPTSVTPASEDSSGRSKKQRKKMKCTEGHTRWWHKRICKGIFQGIIGVIDLCYGFLCLGLLCGMDLYVMNYYMLCLGLLCAMDFYIMNCYVLWIYMLWTFMCYGSLCLTFKSSHMDNEGQLLASLILLWYWLMLVR